MLRLDGFAEVGVAIAVALLEAGRRKDVGGGEDRLPAQRPDAGLVEHLVLAPHPFGFSATHARAHELSPGNGIRGVDMAGGLKQASLVVGRDLGQQPSIGDDGLEELRGNSKAIDEFGAAHGGVRPQVSDGV